MHGFPEQTKFLKAIHKHVAEAAEAGALQPAFKSDTKWTAFIAGAIQSVADEWGLGHHPEYYTIDHVLYRRGDVVPEGPLPLGTSSVHGLWLTRIAVAFEHENHFDTAEGFQEIAKLLLIRADARLVLR